MSMSPTCSPTRTPPRATCSRWRRRTCRSRARRMPASSPGVRATAARSISPSWSARSIPTEPVLIRLHSECFTGDLLGSLRCDCGVQLRGAIAEIAKQGSGVLLYLAQEGRGIGLVNKLRAYELQDDGFDTIDANEQLGFDADERIYAPAATMLTRMGIKRVRLMTNNPEKISPARALRHRGRRARGALLPGQRAQRELPAHQGRARGPLALSDFHACRRSEGNQGPRGSRRPGAVVGRRAGASRPRGAGRARRRPGRRARRRSVRWRPARGSPPTPTRSSRRAS